MTTQPQSRTTFPVRPLAILGVVFVGIGLGVLGVWWYQDSNESTETTTGTALAPWVRPAPPNAVESLAIEKAIHDSGTEFEFGPIPASGLASTVESRAIAEHDNAFPPIEPALTASVVPQSGQTFDEAMADAIAQHGNAFPPSSASTAPAIVVASSVPAGQTFDEAMADALAMAEALAIAHPQAPERKLSPTGVNGFRDFDPEQVGPYVADR